MRKRIPVRIKPDPKEIKWMREHLYDEPRITGTADSDINVFGWEWLSLEKRIQLLEMCESA